VQLGRGEDPTSLVVPDERRGTEGVHPIVWIVSSVSNLLPTMPSQEPNNVLGGPLRPCSTDPNTGFYRTGRCETGPDDTGSHVVCAEMTEAFLQFTKAQGNDLSTPRPAWNFPGLDPGDRWCLCAARWQEALEADVAPPVVLEATHENALNLLALEDLKAHARDVSTS
jgi:uncharacterized protein (DUF2237 family)